MGVGRISQAVRYQSGNKAMQGRRAKNSALTQPAAQRQVLRLDAFYASGASGPPLAVSGQSHPVFHGSGTGAVSSPFNAYCG